MSFTVVSHATMPNAIDPSPESSTVTE